MGSPGRNQDIGEGYEHRARVHVTLLGQRPRRNNKGDRDGNAPPAPPSSPKPCSCEVCEGARANKKPRQHHEERFKPEKQGGDGDPHPPGPRTKKRNFEDIKQAALCPLRIRSFFVAPGQEEDEAQLTPFQVEHCGCENQCCKVMYQKSQEAEEILRGIWRAERQGEQHELFLEILQKCCGPVHEGDGKVGRRFIFAIAGQRVCERYMYDFF